MQCKECGSELRKCVKFCEACGTKVGRFCAQCGTELEESAQFCHKCGHRADGVSYQKHSVSRAMEVKQEKPKKKRELVSGVRGILMSPATLALAILLSVSLAFSLYSEAGLLSWFLSSDIYDYIYEIAYWTDMESVMELGDLLEHMSWMAGGGLTLTALLQQWQLVLVVIGVWCIWASARKEKNQPVKGYGCILFVTVVVHFVYVLATIAFVCAGIYAIYMASNSWLLEDIVGYCVLGVLVGTAILFVVCRFYKQAGEAVGYVRDKASHCRTEGEITEGFVILLYIIAIIKGIQMLSSLGGGFAGFVSNGCYIAALIIAGKLLTRCREETAVSAEPVAADISENIALEIDTQETSDAILDKTSKENNNVL